MHEEYKRRIDCAGAAFEAFYKEKILGHEAKVDGEDSKQEGEEEFANAHKKDWEKKRKRKTEAELLQESLQDNDMYTVLGLEDLGMGATLSDIKSAYKKMALVYHPDKQSNGATDPMWLKVLKAYETLTDPEKKKKYDSTLKFDDTIPEEPVDLEKFFDVFGPVFVRNSIWSVKKNVPHLGDMKTPLKDVYKFYDFWHAFDSWRDFSVFDEYNLEEAESRYEKRYMERENRKIKASHLKKERQRIIKLVNMARDTDPRILKAKKEEEEERLRKKQEQQMKKEKFKQEKLDIKKKEEDEQNAKERKKEEEEKMAKDKKVQLQDDFKKATKVLKALFKDKINAPQYDRFYLEVLIEQMKYEDVVAMNTALENAPPNKTLETFEKFLQDYDRLKAFRKQQTEQTQERNKQIQHEEKKSKETQWGMEEVSLLAKALVKYPVGSKARWECIATFLGTRSVEEVIQKAKDLSKNQSLKITAASITKDAFAQLQKQPGTMKTIDAEPDKRTVYGEFVAPVEIINEAELWSQDQQQTLEKALKEFPTTMEANERWAKIAAAVGSKTKKQCVDRFKVLRNAVIKKQPLK